MKANKIKKIREKTVYYKVMCSAGLFGSFNMNSFDSHALTVLATDPINAIERAKRRGYGLNHSFNINGETEQWANWIVKLSGKSNHWKNLNYF